jgi:glycosyltransferase involved in cell wall biosynthesis
MKIALDATEAAYPEPTGTGVYSRKLIRALAADRRAASFSVRFSLCMRIGPYWKWGRRAVWPAGSSANPFWEPWLQPRPAELFHGLNQRLPRRTYPVSVVTIHDLFPLTSSEYSAPSFQKRFSEILNDAVSRADRIIAVSNATREDLLRHTSASPERITVVHHGVDRIDRASSDEQETFRKEVLGISPVEKFFLNVGVIQTRKNIGNVVLAAARLARSRLVLAGGDGYGAEEIHALIEREGMTGRVMRLGHASPATLRLLYSTAAALVFPSLEEGFGMPVLEAMAGGLPVITSNCSAMPEVAGEAAILVDPRSVSEIEHAMLRVVEDEAFTEELRRRGLQRAALFTWERCAAQTWSVYEDALGQRGLAC